MKKFFLAIVLAALAVPAPSMAVVAKDCFEIVSSDQKLCGEKMDLNALKIKLVNTCPEIMQLKLCLEKEGGKWECRWFRNVHKGETVEMETCGITGNYKKENCEKIRDCESKPE